MTEEVLPSKVGRAVRRRSDLASLRNEYELIIKKLNLSSLQKEFLRFRWLDQVLFHQAQANNWQKLYTSSRLLIIFGGIAVPALSSLTNPAILNIGNPSTVASPTILSGSGALTVGWITFVLGLVVAFSAAMEQFLNSGQRVRYHRNITESLQAEGWAYFQLTGLRYRHFPTHAHAYPRFAQRTEKLLILSQTSDEYITEVARDKGEEDEEEEKSSADRREGK